MSGDRSGRSAELGADDVIRFQDAEHFLDELAGNLGRGRALVRSKRPLEFGHHLSVEIEAPGVDERLGVEAVVVFTRDGYLGLELEDLDQHLERLDQLGQRVEGGSVVGTATVHFDETDHDDTITGEMQIPEGLLEPDPMPQVVDPDQPIPPPSPDTGSSTDDLTSVLSAYVSGHTPPPSDSSARPPRAAIERNDTVLAPPPSFSPPDGDSRSPIPEVDTSPDASPSPNDDSPHPEAQAPAGSDASEDPAADANRVSAVGLEHLESTPSPRMSATGALRVTDASVLLGLWLSGLGQGILTVLGGPEGEPGDAVQIKLIAGRVVTAEAVVRCRVGPWLSLEIGDVSAVRELLVDAHEAWGPVVAELAGTPTSAPPGPGGAIPASPGSPASVSAGGGSASAPSSRPNVPLSNPALGPISSDLVIEAAAGSGDRVRLPEPTEPDEAVEPPRLENDRVLFRHAGDLRREVEVDLANGGLFVVAPPLPIRTKKRLVLQVGQIRLPIIVDADVVYADQGKVGFSIGQSAEVVAALKRFLDEGVPPADTPGELELAGTISGPPSLEQLVELDRHRTGDLEHVETASVLGLFHELVLQQFKGVLEVSSSSGTRRIYLHDGNVAFMESEPFHESTALGQLLTHHRRLSESAFRDGLAQAKTSHRPLGSMLVALGLAKSSDVVSALREQTRARLEAAFEWVDGAFEIQTWREPPGRGDLVVTRGLGVLAHHLRHKFAQLGVAEMERLLAHRLRDGVEIASDLDQKATALGLPPKEVRFLQVSLGDRSLEEAIRFSPLGKLASLRLSALAFGLGLAKPQAVKGPNQGPADPRDDSAQRLERMRKELRARLDTLAQQNHFEVLGVHWSSHHRTFQAAYEALLAEFSTVRGRYKDAPNDIKELAKQCTAHVKRAFAILADDARRTAYRGELFDRTEREYSAQMLVEKGEVALMRGDRVGAIEHLETAVELAPIERYRSLLRAAREGRR